MCRLFCLEVTKAVRSAWIVLKSKPAAPVSIGASEFVDHFGGHILILSCTGKPDVG